MENDTIWKVGLVVLVLLVVVGVYNNNNRGVEDVTGQVIGNINEVGVFKQVGIGTSVPGIYNLNVVGFIKGDDLKLNYGATIGGYLYTNTISSNPSGGKIDFVDNVMVGNHKNLYVTGGNVGIGTIKPDVKLHVIGDIKGSRLCIYDDCRDSWPNSGWIVLANNDVYYNRGNVGIGIGNPTAKLDVNGNVKGTRLCIGNDCRDSWPNSGWRIVLANNNVYYNRGNVGIGTSTPTNKLHVVGGVTIDDPNAQIEFYGESGKKWVVGSSGGAGDNFNIYDRGSSSTRLTIDQTSGNVGIGTSNPTVKLDVVGKIKVSDDLTAKSLYTNSIASNPLGGQVSFIDNVQVGNNKNLIVTGLTGTGTAYVCVDSSGKLIRKNTPCV